jgi:hypothetical protein
VPSSCRRTSAGVQPTPAAPLRILTDAELQKLELDNTLAALERCRR